jgi:F-type H+-transporting ATPase subunit epsilon
MNLEILTPGKKIYSGQITLIKVPGRLGSFEILNNHAPIVSTLDKGKIKIITTDKKEIFFDIEGGVVEASENNIIILADTL